MIRINSKVSKEEWFTTRLVTSAVWLNGYEYGIDLSERLRIITFQDPSFLWVVVLVENPEAERLLLVRPPPPHAWNAAAFFTEACWSKS
jgi:hypothetical protein